MKLNSFMLRIAFAVTIAGALSTLALAHTHLEKTEPADGAVLKASPSHVELWFNEKPDLTVSKITVAGSSGAVAVGPTRSVSGKSMMADIKARLSDGKYVVSWQAAGDDGHVSKGQFGFSVTSGH